MNLSKEKIMFFYTNTKSFFTFFFKSLLVSILCLMVFITFMFFIYCGDLLLNVNNKNNYPLFGAYLIVSQSMVPTIGKNDAIVIKREDHDKYNVGDIITFMSNDINYSGLLITHRIVAKDYIDSAHSLYTTKGDNNDVIDASKVNTDSIYGKVLFKVPKIGYLKNYLSKPSNFFLSLLSVVVIVLLYDMGRIFKNLYNKK